MTNDQLTGERLVKILSETKATIMEHNSRCVRGSVEVDAQLFESMIMELQERRKVAEPELNPANLANKFYERYPLATFKSDSERAEAFGYFMAGAELQCFGEFIKYEDLCGDE